MSIAVAGACGIWLSRAAHRVIPALLIHFATSKIIGLTLVVRQSVGASASHWNHSVWSGPE